MRSSLLLIALAICSNCFSQDTTGMIAHWDFNGTVNDVSGHGHNGHAVNVVPALGKDSVMGHAYYFNGLNSMVSVPYSSAFNLTKFSLCATIKVLDFYSGTCATNMILTRGKTGTGVGTYQVYYSDFPTNAGCTLFDSTLEVFAGSAGGFGTTGSDYSYTPHVEHEKWYQIVVTFNDTVFKQYVNDTLKSSAVVYTPGPMSSSTDSISIGYNIFEPAFPYPLNGLIDDIRIYNRVLSDTEINLYSNHPQDTVRITTGAEAPVIGKAVNIFPNPSREMITIEMNNPQQAVVKLFDIFGRQINEAKLENRNNHINISGLAPGVYIARIFCGDDVYACRFMKIE